MLIGLCAVRHCCVLCSCLLSTKPPTPPRSFTLQAASHDCLQLHQAHGICLGRSDPKSPDFALFVRTDLGAECTHSDRVPCFGGHLVRISYRTLPSIELENMCFICHYVRTSSASVWSGSHESFLSLLCALWAMVGSDLAASSPLLSRLGSDVGYLGDRKCTHHDQTWNHFLTQNCPHRDWTSPRICHAPAPSYLDHTPSSGFAACHH